MSDHALKELQKEKKALEGQMRGQLQDFLNKHKVQLDGLYANTIPSRSCGEETQCIVSEVNIRITV